MKTKYKNNDHLPRYYSGDTRYERVKEQMDLLGITDVTTNRQNRNGTVVWQLPIKNNNSGKTFIEVASFASGYVRNNNSGYSNYQLNKRCESEPEYFKLSNGDYRKFTTKGCVLIPIEIDRLEYLISYCLKNYFIKRANEVANGEYVSKSYHEWELERQDDPNEIFVSKDLNRIQDLESVVQLLQADLDKANSTKDYSVKLEEKLYDLQNKLATIQRIADHG